MKAAGIFTSILVAMVVSVFGADVPNDLKDDPIDCDALKNDPEHHYRNYVAANAKGEAIDFAQMDTFRQRFWETYPDKPGYEKARENFAQALYLRDIFYLRSRLVARIHGENPGAFQGRPRDGSMKGLEELLTASVAGNIPQSAEYEFDVWVNATREALGKFRTEDEIVANLFQVSLGILSDKFRKASNPSGKEYQEYLMERDWAEFDAKRVIPRGYRTRERYGILLYFRRGKVSFHDARAIYSGMTNALGAPVVESAAEKLLAYFEKISRPVIADMIVTVPEPWKVGPGGSKLPDDTVPMPDEVIGTYRDPLVALEILATKDDDHRYLLYLLKGLYFRENRGRFGVDNKWNFAVEAYNRLKLAFSEKEVLEVAHTIRAAKKNMTSGDVIDPKAIGSTRTTPFSAFEDILARKNPVGYVRAALIFNENLKTPAEVDAAYKQFVSDRDEKPVLDAAREMAAARPNLLFGGEIETLDKVLEGELTFKKPPPAPGSLVDFPQYIAWKKFAPGAKVSYTTRFWSPHRLDPNRLVPGPPEHRHAYQLQSINDEQAKLWFTETMFSDGKPREPRDTEIGYPAKYAPSPTRQSSTDANAPVSTSNWAYDTERTAAPVESGEEIIEINGKRITTRWQSATYRYKDNAFYKGNTLVVKVWTSDEVPTGLVRKTEDRAGPPAPMSPGGRYILETYLDSFGGFTPATPNSSGPVTTAYVPPPVASKSDGASSQVTPAPETKPAPQQVPASPRKRRLFGF